MTAVVLPRLVVRPVFVESVHDGDSVYVRVPIEALWPEMQRNVFYIRVAHCNAAEIGTPEGKAAREAVRAWLNTHPPSAMQVYGREKWRRTLADLETDAGLLSDFILQLEGSRPESAIRQLSAGRST